MRDRGGSVLAEGLVVAMCAACSSAYIPHPGPRLSLTMDDGSFAYVRDGHKYEGGFFGGQIEEAVRGNPQAEAYAHAYRSGMVTGFALELISLAGIIGGAQPHLFDAVNAYNDGLTGPGPASAPAPVPAPAPSSF